MPSSDLCARKALPSSRSTSPRLGAGRSRQLRKALWARPTISSYSPSDTSLTLASLEPSTGVCAVISSSLPSHAP